MISIPGWPDETHTTPGQVKRILAALKLKPKTVEAHADGSYSILGSGTIPYTVTLDSCTCRDFELRRRPCKHMYYVALQKGLPVELPPRKPKRDQAFSPSKELKRLRELYMSGDIDPELYVKVAEPLSKLKNAPKPTTPKPTRMPKAEREWDQIKKWRAEARSCQRARTLTGALDAIDQMEGLEFEGMRMYSPKLLARTRDIVRALPVVPLVHPSHHGSIELHYHSASAGDLDLTVTEEDEHVRYLEDGSGILEEKLLASETLFDAVRAFCETAGLL